MTHFRDTLNDEIFPNLESPFFCYALCYNSFVFSSSVRAGKSLACTSSSKPNTAPRRAKTIEEGDTQGHGHGLDLNLGQGQGHTPGQGQSQDRSHHQGDEDSTLRQKKDIETSERSKFCKIIS